MPATGGRHDRKDMLLEAGLVLASELSLPIVLQRIVDLAAQVTDARYGALGVIGDGERLVEFVTTGIGARERQAIGALPTGHGVLGVLIREPKPVRIKNIAEHPQSVGFPPNHPPMGSFLGAPVQAMGKVYGNIYLAEKRSASEFSEEDEKAIIILAAQAGVAIANATLYEEVRSRERWLDALRDITNQVLRGTGEAALLESITAHARALAEADTALMVTGTDVPGELIVAASAGAKARELRGQTMPAEGSISGAVMFSGAGLVIDDLDADPRAYQPIVALGGFGPAFYVPLHVVGTLSVANVKGGRRFTARDRLLVESLAEAASVAIRYDRAQSELRRLGLMEERERIAKELHDGIIQSLFAVGMGLQAAALRSSDVHTSARLEHAVEELDRVILDLRNYIFGLRPGILADRELDQALRTLADGRVEVDVDSELAARLSGRSTDIVQLTREALSNVARHAQAKRATVRLERQGRQAMLTVEDDGVGFVVRTDGAGNGLRNMRDRAAKLGGSLDINSSPGKGTVLRVTFPV